MSDPMVTCTKVLVVVLSVHENYTQGVSIVSCNVMEPKSKQTILGLPCAGMYLRVGDVVSVTLEKIQHLVR